MAKTPKFDIAQVYHTQKKALHSGGLRVSGRDSADEVVQAETIPENG